MSALHIVVTCSNRKTQEVPSHLRLGSVGGSTTVERAQLWTSRLAADRTVPLPARELYSGEHWSVAGTLPTEYEGSDNAHLWVCSAGYGLISADAPIRPYSATFTSGHPDSVPWQSGSAAAWWQALAAWEGPQPGVPRSISTLASADPDGTFLLVLSPPYLRATRDDVIEASAVVNDTNRFMVVSAGAGPNHELASLIVPADARVQTALRGSRLSINARVARALVISRALTRSTAIATMREIVEDQPAPTIYRRQQMSDDEIVSYISNSLSQVSRVSPTRLLRSLRDSGRACEQNRFHQLYARITGGRHGDR